MQPPVIVLVEPQMGENIGASARVMANFGFSELRIVNPRDGWPNPAAIAMAANATNIVEAAKIYPTLPEAIADCRLVAATTARMRVMSKTVDSVREWVEKAPHVKTAILFGKERSGLSNEELAQAHSLLTIPVDPTYPSLNLAQSVGLVAYEWFQKYPSPGAIPMPERLPAAQVSLSHLFTQMEEALDRVNYWQVPHKKDRMWQNLRSTFLQANLTEQEVQSLRGMIKALQWKPRD